MHSCSLSVAQIQLRIVNSVLTTEPPNCRGNKQLSELNVKTVVALTVIQYHLFTYECIHDSNCLWTWTCARHPDQCKTMSRYQNETSEKMWKPISHLEFLRGTFKMKKQKQEFISLNLNMWCTFKAVWVWKNRRAIIWWTAAIYAKSLTETHIKLKYWRPFLNT